MAEKKQAKIIDAWRQKKWYSINSPAQFGSRKIGEGFAMNDEDMAKRTVKISLSVVTGDMKKQNIIGVFEVNEIKNGNAETTVKKLEISPSSIRRMIRKGKDRIDLSIVCATKDNVLVRIKPFLVTRAQIGGSLLTKMRNLLEALLRNEVSKVSYDGLIRDIMIGKLQKRAKQVVGKIYPIRTSEIRLIEKTKYDKPLPPIPELPEFKEEKLEETEEEKIEKRLKQSEDLADEEAKAKKLKAKKEAKAEA